MSPLQLLTAVAERQHLLVATWQARAVGVPAGVLRERVANQGWRLWHHGVVALPGPSTGHRRAAAAVLAYSKPRSGLQRIAPCADQKSFIAAVVEAAWNAGQLLWGPSALWLYGLIRQPADTYIRLPARSGLFPREGVQLRFGALRSGMVRRVDGFYVPVIEQAILEYAAFKTRAGIDDVNEVIAKAHAKRQTTLDKLDATLAAVGPANGTRVLALSVAAMRGELSHSRTERKGRRIVIEVARQYRLTVGSRPLTVMLGSMVAGEADVPVLEVKLDIEIDGPHHDMPEQRAVDIARDRLMRRAGWIVERFPTKLIEKSPDRFRAQVDEAIRDVLRVRGLTPDRIHNAS